MRKSIKKEEITAYLKRTQDCIQDSVYPEEKRHFLKSLFVIFLFAKSLNVLTANEVKETKEFLSDWGVIVDGLEKEYN